MSMWLVNVAGVVVIGVIVWWFWLSKPAAQRTEAGRPIEIIVDNGTYTPARIEVALGRPLTLRFIRKDPSPCAEKVLLDDFNISSDLPMGRPHDISFTPDTPGEHEFTCQMRMYRGSLVVRES
jgi:plastocyanin domain-containing protein